MIVIAYGGTGSSYLLKNSDKFYDPRKIHRRPTVDMKPSFWPSGKVVALSNHNGYEMRMPSAAVGRMSIRTRGFWADDTLSIEENLRKYFILAGATDTLAIVTWPTFYGFFSRNRIKNIVFIIRHPLHQSIGWLELGRKSDGDSFASDGNDLYSIVGIDRFIRMWNANIDELLRLQHLKLQPIVVRFEYIHEDIKQIPNATLRQCFEGFQTTSRHYNAMPISLEQRLRHRCIWHGFYDKWEI